MLQLGEQDLIEVERAYCARGLSYFTRRAWRHFDPQPYQHGWHMDAVGEHLEAAASGEIKRLLINVPPGTSKSTLTCVTFPAWLWGPAGWPSAKFIGASYESTLASRDNRRTRQLIQTDWYQRRWPCELVSDQNEKTYFENDKMGFRQSSAVTAMTGRRADFVVWDDPLSPEKAYSEPHRETAVRVFQETLPLRLVSPELSVIVINMQRLHEGDVSGHILENDYGYTHLCLPMEFEPDRKCYTNIGWEDPRTEEGELLMPSRFPKEVVERDKKVMGSFATAGQFQQRPSPRGGGMFKRHWFEIKEAAPAGVRWIRGWDLAATDDPSAARTAGVKVGVHGEGSKRTFWVGNVVKGQLGPADVEKLIAQTAALDGELVEGSLPQDPGAGGKAWAQALVTAAAGYTYRKSPETGDKVTRAQPFAAQAEAGNVYLIKGDWNEEYLDELTTFPAGKFKDQVDASSRAFMALAKPSAPTPLVGLYGTQE